MKHCKACGADKEAGEFYKKADGVQGLSTRCKVCHDKQRRQADPLFHMRAAFHGRRRAALSAGVPFSIRLEDLLPLPSHCPVFGEPLSTGPSGGHDWSPSIDRIVPHLGYVPGNVVVVSMKANRIKNDATVQDLHRVADYYLSLNETKP